jgi:hypothetical protein
LEADPFLSYPPHIKILWIKSSVKELKELIKEGTVVHENRNNDDNIIPITAKYRVKLTSEGLVEKLKTRIALRGDMIRETFTPETWCPIAGFRALKMFLAFAAVTAPHEGFVSPVIPIPYQPISLKTSRQENDHLP